MPQFERESIDYDVVIVGAGPAGLSAAIKLKQLEPDLQVVILEKGAEVGSHIISGAVLDPKGLDKLFPNWREKETPIRTPVSEDKFYFLGPAGGIRLPNFLMPPLMSNEGNYVVSMSKVCRWLSREAEDLGVEIFPGMACSELIYGKENHVTGVIAGEFGKTEDGNPGPMYEPGMEVNGKYIFLAEGVRGSLAKQVISKYDLAAESDVPKHGIGMKEVWEIRPENHKEGQVLHTMGWPLGNNPGGGSFVYHAENNQLFIGFVVHLDYTNPSLFPYKEFQKFKHHPMIKKLLMGGKRIEYGARAISEGGIQSIPKMNFPGGLLLGCSAGLVNVPRIKGNHNAILSGICAAEVACTALQSGRANDDLTNYELKIRSGPIYQDLMPVRNVKPLWSRFGLFVGIILGALDMWVASVLSFNLFGNINHKFADHDKLRPISNCKVITYPKPDGKISFERLENISFSGTSHSDGQPCHLSLGDQSVPVNHNLPIYDEPAQRYCPAGVYEIVREGSGSTPRFQINYQNCVHCKTCDIKDPSQNITWKTPQGGEGPNYSHM
ncbi:MAG: electron transfer flavoprotein-ubiquinone oxidoreductase [Rhodobacteraceae bacterium]|nr:MAG: electron transfer flavoprotein-ubiquinone oxidoreductase [Paracoccaceae bacterium]